MLLNFFLIEREIVVNNHCMFDKIQQFLDKLYIVLQVEC